MKLDYSWIDDRRESRRELEYSWIDDQLETGIPDDNQYYQKYILL